MSKLQIFATKNKYAIITVVLVVLLAGAGTQIYFSTQNEIKKNAMVKQNPTTQKLSQDRLTSPQANDIFEDKKIYDEDLKTYSKFMEIPYTKENVDKKLVFKNNYEGKDYEITATLREYKSGVAGSEKIYYALEITNSQEDSENLLKHSFMNAFEYEGKRYGVGIHIKGKDKNDLLYIDNHYTNGLFDYDVTQEVELNQLDGKTRKLYYTDSL